jgi:hypothetical protein
MEDRMHALRCVRSVGGAGLHKQTEGKSRKEAIRCLKRRISDAIYRALRTDAGD